MRAVIQRVAEASVSIGGTVHAEIKSGLLILLGIESDDSEDDIVWLVAKIHNMRIFNDQDGIMNLSNHDIGGQYLVVSQFTLHASTKKGNRPSYIKAAKPEIAIPLYNDFIKKLTLTAEQEVSTGIFGADMAVSLVNDGPVTIIIDTKNKE
jgi:D-tyrosyl-tRNA(Tyr) deacylase